MPIRRATVEVETERVAAAWLGDSGNQGQKAYRALGTAVHGNRQGLVGRLRNGIFDRSVLRVKVG